MFGSAPVIEEVNPDGTKIRASVQSVLRGSIGLYLDHQAGGKVTFLFTTDVDTRRAELLTIFTASPDRLVVRQVASTDAQLNSAKDLLSADSSYLASIGLDEVSVDTVRNAVLLNGPGANTQTLATLQARYGDLGVQVDLQPAGSIQPQIVLLPLGQWHGPGFPQAMVDKDGRFTLTDVVPGRWRAQVSNIPGGIRSATFGDHEISPESFTIPPGGGGPLNLVITTKPFPVTFSVRGVDASRRRGDTGLHPRRDHRAADGLRDGARRRRRIALGRPAAAHRPGAGAGPPAEGVDPGQRLSRSTPPGHAVRAGAAKDRHEFTARPWLSE